MIIKFLHVNHSMIPNISNATSTTTTTTNKTKSTLKKLLDSDFFQNETEDTNYKKCS